MSRQRNIAEADEIPDVLARTASDGVVRFLRSLIHAGELGPGDRLLPERELSAQLGVSRVTLRLALKTLEAMGYICTRRGVHGGAFVSELPVLLERWAEWMRANRQELDDIIDFRIAVETKAAALAAERRTEAELASIEAPIARLGVTRQSFLRADAEFHKAVARAAHNVRLDRAMRVARGELFLPVDQVIRDDRIPDTESGHRAIFMAIRAQDPVGAAAAMEVHIEYTRAYMRAIQEGAVQNLSLEVPILRPAVPSPKALRAGLR